MIAPWAFPLSENGTSGRRGGHNPELWAPLNGDPISIWRDLFHSDHVSSANAILFEKSTDPAAFTEEPFGTVKISYDIFSAAPIYGNLAFCGQRAVRSAYCISGKNIENAT
ncbi:hypothetical protein [Roseospirillum parvum]|uniref:hypothetical protein n=1 Tax=Roseospirillum parvum TaxID=83401 RepID=UPI001C4095C8|nr:hypothetical protein [Roseospirillum parvum]